MTSGARVPAEAGAPGLVPRVKALGGRAVVQTRLALRGASPRGLERVWAYTDDCAGLGRHPPADPRQGGRHVFPGLGARPWHDPPRQAWVDALARATAALRAEAARLWTAGGFADDAGDMVLPTWHVHLLCCLGSRLRTDGAAAAAAEAVATVPRRASTGLCFLAALPPGAEAPLACGPTNSRLRCELGLDVPDGCAREVADETRHWDEGAWLAFDDSFPHRAWNRSDRPLLLLVVDVWHPDIADREALALDLFMQISPESVQRRRFARANLGRRGDPPRG